ncbi:MAG TPA: aminotransferase class V-fold PLP-dependent enzyme [Candidatus Nanopelagicales bacterium]|nr:aminotransferase class V-fold PLP-dependent enzyme [Candidatus Nanopelagicales bacterium]
MSEPNPPERERLAVLRAGLPATRAGIYLNTGTAGPLPAEAAAAMADVADRELAVGRATRESYEELIARMDEARAVVAAVLGTEIDLVALTHSTTEGINLALGTINWRPGDRAVTTSLEHPGVTGPLALLRDRLGVEVVEAEIGDGGDDARTLAALEAAAGGGRTRAIVASHVAWSTGALLPAASIAALARRCGAVGILDGAQSAGAIPLAVDEIGADFYAVSGQKWLLGPEGTGALAVGRSDVASVLPPVGGFFAASTPYAVGRDALWPDARRFETAGYHKPSIVGLARSAGWLSMFAGLPWAHERAAQLATGAAERLAGTPGVTLVTPRARMATLVSFRVAGWSAEEVAVALGRRVHAIVRSIPGLDAVRLSVAFFTTDDELRRVLDAVEEVAAHTPATLPARPAIEFLDQAQG